MRKICILIVVVLLCNTAHAQFEAGESFVDGTFSNYLTTSKGGGESSKTRNYSHDISVSFGKFIKSNKAVGWGITNHLTTERYDNSGMSSKTVRDFGIGAQRIWEFYKPLHPKIALYARPSVGLFYNLGSENSQEVNRIAKEIRNHRITVGASIGAGLAWRISPKWALLGGLTFNNPFNISATLSRSEDFLNKDTQGDNLTSRNKTLEYQLTPAISSGGISLGFRYFY